VALAAVALVTAAAGGRFGAGTVRDFARLPGSETWKVPHL
jgi:hypothetical protein